MRKPCGNVLLHFAAPLAKWACLFSVTDHPLAAGRRQRRPQRGQEGQQGLAGHHAQLGWRLRFRIVFPGDCALSHAEQRGECIWQARSENNHAEVMRKQHSRAGHPPRRISGEKHQLAIMLRGPCRQHIKKEAYFQQAWPSGSRHHQPCV